MTLDVHKRRTDTVSFVHVDYANKKHKCDFLGERCPGQRNSFIEVDTNESKGKKQKVILHGIQDRMKKGGGGGKRESLPYSSPPHPFQSFASCCAHDVYGV